MDPDSLGASGRLMSTMRTKPSPAPMSIEPARADAAGLSTVPFEPGAVDELGPPLAPFGLVASGLVPASSSSTSTNATSAVIASLSRPSSTSPSITGCGATMTRPVRS